MVSYSPKDSVTVLELGEEKLSESTAMAVMVLSVLLTGMSSTLNVPSSDTFPVVTSVLLT